MTTKVSWHENYVHFSYEGKTCLADIFDAKWESNNSPYIESPDKLMHDFSTATSIDALAAALIADVETSRAENKNSCRKKIAVITTDMDFKYLLGKFKRCTQSELLTFRTLHDAKQWLHV
jgi:hypothetical protein